MEGRRVKGLRCGFGGSRLRPGAATHRQFSASERTVRTTTRCAGPAAVWLVDNEKVDQDPNRKSLSPKFRLPSRSTNKFMAPVGSGNARLYIDFQKHGQIAPEQSWTMGLAPLFVPLAEQPRQRSAKPPRRVQLSHGTPIFLSSIGVERYTLVAVRQDLPSRNTRRDTVMLDHFPQLNPVCRQRPRTVDIPAANR